MTYTSNKNIDGLDALTSLDDTDVLIAGDQSDSDRAKKITKADFEADLDVTASQVSDFDTEVENNSAVAANTAKVTYPGSADAAELNILDGATLTTTELNYVDGVTSAIQTQLDAKVADTGNETIAGVKTFSSSPIVPTPTTDMQASTKKYVDDNAGSGTPEGTAIKSTGETGATKYLREDGDGTCSWQTPAGSGNVNTSGSPVDNDFAKFVNGTDIEGRSYAEVKTDLDYQANEIDIADAGGYYTATDVEAALQEIRAANAAKNDNTGFPTKTTSTIAFTDGTRTFSIQPTSGSFDFYEDSILYTSTGNTVVIDDTEGIHVIYYDEGVLTAVVNPAGNVMANIIMTKPLVSIIYWDATDNEAIYVGEERHGMQMDGNTHAYLHYSNGLVYRSGLGLNTMSVDGSGTTADAQFGIDAGGVSDEDLGLQISAVASTTGLPIYHMEGSTPEWKKTVVSGFSARTLDNTSADRLAWNEYTGGSWQLSEVDNNDFVLCHVFATTEKDTPMIAIMGQNEYNTKAQARTGAQTEINNLILNDIMFPEIRPIATVIFQTNTAYASAINAKVVSTDEGDDFIDWRNQVVSRVELSTSDHNSLNNLQGGASGDYYHLTEAQNTLATQYASGTQDGLLQDSDWTTFNNKQSALTFGIANDNAVEIDSTSVADNEYARFTANGLESRSNAEVLSDIGAGTMSDVVDDTTPQLGGELDAQENSIGFTLQTATGDGTTTIDWKDGNKFKFTFGAFNETFTFTAPTKVGAFQLILVQDSTGSRTATWPTSVKWSGGTAPTLTTAANSVDIVSFLYDGTNYYATSSLNFS